MLSFSLPFPAYQLNGCPLTILLPLNDYNQIARVDEFLRLDQSKIKTI